jgi:hypothetical protein
MKNTDEKKINTQSSFLQYTPIEEKSKPIADFFSSFFLISSIGRSIAARNIRFFTAKKVSLPFKIPRIYQYARAFRKKMTKKMQKQ